jgi:2-polyprenyl-3-methyl-5-hydroxy-6-metoxy-1,4-benzoquinol methylase
VVKALIAKIYKKICPPLRRQIFLFCDTIAIMLPTKPSKYLFQTELCKRIEQVEPGKNIRLLEIGSGTSEIAKNLTQKFSCIEYVGIEPSHEAVVQARKNLQGSPRAVIIEGLGYDKESHPELQQPFDIVFSLSVLEHVKQLEKFIDFSVSMARMGGEVAHLYDLGHSLHPSSTKEWLQTRLCATPLLKLFPEHKVARYVATEETKKLLEKNCDIQKTTFSNMPNLVQLVKNHLQEDLLQEVNAFEQAHAEKIIDLKKREKLFPSICFWAKRVR